MSPLSALCLKTIDFYQEKIGARALLVECNFTPTCSEYMKQAIVRHGAARGFLLGVKRIHRCKDRDSVGKIVDPVPE